MWSIWYEKCMNVTLPVLVLTEYSTSVQVKQDAMAELEALKAEGHKKWWDNFWTGSLGMRFYILQVGTCILIHHSVCRNLDGSMFLFYVDRLDTCGYTRCFRLLIQVLSQPLHFVSRYGISSPCLQGGLRTFVTLTKHLGLTELWSVGDLGTTDSILAGIDGLHVPTLSLGCAVLWWILVSDFCWSQYQGHETIWLRAAISLLVWGPRRCATVCNSCIFFGLILRLTWLKSRGQVPGNQGWQRHFWRQQSCQRWSPTKTPSFHLLRWKW